MKRSCTYASNHAAALLASDWSPRQMRQRATEATGVSGSDFRSLVRRIRRTFPTHPTAAAHDLLTEFLVQRFDVQEQYLGRIFWITPQMASDPKWQVPVITTTTALAERLGLTPGQLDWFADCRGLERRPTANLRHYSYQWLTSRSGKRRLLEVPRPRLKAIQRGLLHDILDLIPSHDAAHGYRLGRSIITYAEPHASQPMVIRMDLRDFFPSVGLARVRAIFRAVGYPRDVARALAGLCTNVTPDDVWPADSDPGSRSRFCSPHLPQGAPTSPALANLAAYRLDVRLAGLAKSVHANYTRYADDLAFSGGDLLQRSLDWFPVTVGVIALEEGFEINFRETRLMPRSRHQHLAGVVVNERPNGRRADYDHLEAILFNCLRHGPAGQNRLVVPDFRAHLAGRLAHLARLNAARGRRLRELFDRIDWDGVMGKTDLPSSS